MYLVFIFVCVQILAGNIHAASVPTDKIREEPTKCPEYPDDFTETLEIEEKNYRNALAAGNLAAISPKEMERRATCVYQHLGLIKPDNSGDLQAVLSFLIITNPIIKEQIPFPEEKLENLKRCLAKKSDSADEARDWINVCIKENFQSRPLRYEPEVADQCPEYPENKSMREIIEMEERNYQAALREKNFAAISDKEMERRTTCIYKHLGLINPDNSADLQAVMSFFSIISPAFKEQIPAPEETLDNLKRCLAKKSDSADEARDWILVCVKENFRLLPLDYEPEVADKCPEYPENKSMEEILEIEERNFQAATSEKEIKRRTTCIYQSLGLIKPDNSADLQAVMSFFSLTSPIFREQIPAPEEKLENLERCLSKRSDSADEASDWILVCVKDNFRLYPVGYELEVGPIDNSLKKVSKKCPEYPDNLMKIMEIEKKHYQSAILNKNFAAISEKEMGRRVTCIYQHMGLINPDNSGDLQAVMSFFSVTNPNFKEQLPAPEKKIENLERCLAKKSDSAEAAKDWILICVKENFRLYPLEYEPEVKAYPKKHINYI